VGQIQAHPATRHDRRAELTLTWREILRLVDEERQAEVQAEGGSAPGWYDAPRGGYIDRAGRLVVADDEADSETDASRMVGPAFITVGAIAAIGGWYLVDSSALLVLGIGLVILGLFTPR
jgi:secreted PhoX family phosphatase